MPQSNSFPPVQRPIRPPAVVTYVVAPEPATDEPEEVDWESYYDDIGTVD